MFTQRITVSHVDATVAYDAPINFALEDIPGADATDDEVLEHLADVVSFSSYSRSAMDSAAMYQFSTEMGYYGYVTKNVSDLLSREHYPNSAFAPRDAELEYDPKLMRDIGEWLKEKGDHIIYIYGGLDPWSAPAVEINEGTNAVNFTLKDGNHYTFIDTFPEAQRNEILDTLEAWLGVKVDRYEVTRE